MILYEHFVTVMLITVVVSFILAMGFLFLSQYQIKFCRVVGVISIVACLLTFGFGVLALQTFRENSILNAKIDKTYSNPEISATEAKLCPLDKTPYYLVKENGEYIYRTTHGNSEKTSRVDASQCEIEFSDEEPSFITQSIVTECHSEWFFLYDDKTEQEQNFIIIVPKKESVLDLS